MDSHPGASSQRGRLVVASASPRRHQLLSQAGYTFEVQPADIDETPLPGEGATAYVERLARSKAHVVAGARSDAVVLGADTIVTIDDELLGKPRDSSEAEHMLRRLSAEHHQVMTGVAVVVGGRTVSGVDVSNVWFRELSDVEIRRYVATGEPLDKAGAYAIQGLGSALVVHVDGSWDNIVGLPMQLVEELFKRR